MNAMSNVHGSADALPPNLLRPKPICNVSLVLRSQYPARTRLQRFETYHLSSCIVCHADCVLLCQIVTDSVGQMNNISVRPMSARYSISFTIYET